MKRSITVRRSWNSWNWKKDDPQGVSFRGTYSGHDGVADVYWEPYRASAYDGKRIGGYIVYDVTLFGINFYMTEYGERTARGIGLIAGRFLKECAALSDNHGMQRIEHEELKGHRLELAANFNATA